jgi:hypothetical protein
MAGELAIKAGSARGDRRLLAALALATLLQVVLALRSSAVCMDAPGFVAMARALQSDPIAAIRALRPASGFRRPST